MENISKAFVTQCSGDGKPCIKMQFQTLDEMHSGYSELCVAIKAHGTEPSPAEVSSEGVRESDKQLLKFYDVSTLHELIDAQEKHILKLQETARRYLPQQHIATNGGRHG